MRPDSRTPEDIARERAELEREPAARRARGLRVVREEPAFAGIHESLSRIQAASDARRTRLLAESCPSCASPSGQRAATCAASGVEWCKWAEQLAHATREAELTATRRARLEDAGVTHRGVLDAFPPARRPPDPGPLVAREVAEAARAPMRAAMQFLADRKLVNLTLAGAPGAGKTWAAAWVVAASDGAVWVTCSDIVPGDEWSRLRANARRARLVVLNDVGSGPRFDWRDAEIESLLVSRDDASLRTVITTNLTPAEIKARFGDRMHRRLVSTVGLAVECAGPDLSAVRP